MTADLSPQADPTADERWARAALCRAALAGDDRIVRSLRDVGAVATLRRLGAIEAGLLGASDVDADLERLASIGGRLLIPGDAEWPTVLDTMPLPPYALWVVGTGNLDEWTREAVTVVGMRACTPYGELIAAEVASGLSGRGITVVSGGSFGIDAAAHRGALAIGGRTVCVLACGVDVAYPTSNENLLNRIGTAGLLVSEYPCGWSHNSARQTARARLLPAFSAGTVVVEANVRSGSLAVAAQTVALDRPVMAFPGRVTSVESRGTHGLIRAGHAHMVTTTDEVLETTALRQDVPA